MSPEGRTQVGVRLPDALARRLRIYAVTANRSVQDVVEEAVTRLLADRAGPATRKGRKHGAK